MGQSPDRPASPPPSPVQNLTAIAVPENATSTITDYRDDGTAAVTVFTDQPGAVHFHPNVPVGNPTNQVRRVATPVKPADAN